MRLIDRLGFDAVDAGQLANGVALEPDGSPVAITHTAQQLSKLVSRRADRPRQHHGAPSLARPNHRYTPRSRWRRLATQRDRRANGLISKRVTPNQRSWASPPPPHAEVEVSTGWTLGTPVPFWFERTPWQGRSLPAVAHLCNKKAPCAGLFYGRYWTRTSDPQLVDLGRPFAPVRSGALKQHG
jgi:hypothetical protein